FRRRCVRRVNPQQRLAWPVTTAALSARQVRATTVRPAARYSLSPFALEVLSMSRKNAKTVRTAAAVRERQAALLAKAQASVERAKAALAKAAARLAKVQAEDQHKDRRAELAEEMRKERAALARLREQDTSPAQPKT